MTCRGFKHIPFKGHLCDDMSTGHLKGRIQCTEGPYFRQLSTPKINAFLVDGKMCREYCNEYKIIFINVFVQILCLFAKLSSPIYLAHLILKHCQILRLLLDKYLHYLYYMFT